MQYDGIGYSVHGNTTTTYSPTYIISNTVISTGDAGVEIYFVDVAYNVTSNAAVNIGDFHIKQNDLSGGVDGVRIEYSPGNVYRDISSTAAFRMPDYFIENNVIGGAQTGLHLGAFGNGVSKIIHNTVASSTLSSGTGIEVISGTVSITDTILSSYKTGISNTGGIVNEDYNLFSGNTSDTAGSITSGGNSFNGIPGFVNPAGHDYHLDSTSDAVDAGIDAGINEDKDGNPRPVGIGFDIGAYEYFYNLQVVNLPVIYR